MVKSSKKAVLSVTLEGQIDPGAAKRLSLSNDGVWCVIAGGGGKSYFYLVDIVNEAQYKLISTNLECTYAPCFINGDSEYVAVGAPGGKIEIWNVETKSSVKMIETGTDKPVAALHSANDILAVVSWDKKLSLWHVKNWNMFYSKDIEMQPYSVHLTKDSKYLTLGGYYGERCVIFEIK